MRKLLPTPPRNDRQTRRKQHKHQCNEKGRRSLLHGEPNGGLPFMLYSFLASVFKSHQSARVLCCISEMSPLAWKNWNVEKLSFCNFFILKVAHYMRKRRTFVRRFLRCIFHQHILVRPVRFERMAFGVGVVFQTHNMLHSIIHYKHNRPYFIKNISFSNIW